MKYCTNLVVIEVGKCILSAFQGSIESERTVHSDSSSILQTLETRSLLDCVDQCMSLRMCYGALYTEEGRRNNYNRGGYQCIKYMIPSQTSFFCLLIIYISLLCNQVIDNILDIESGKVYFNHQQNCFSKAQFWAVLFKFNNC